jgi:hypothetical protein
MIPRWLKVVTGFGVFLVVVLVFINNLAQDVKISCARRVVFGLQVDRDAALRSDVPEAARRLLGVSEGHNMKQKAGSPLDQICNLQRTNVMRDIIAYLRAKTGEDLGDRPEPWILKYAPKN